MTHDEVILDIRDITIPKRRLRKVDDVAELAASIRKSGQLHPIIVRKDDREFRDGRQHYILIAGRRRIKAIKGLHEFGIRARVLDVSDSEATLIEIDENLMRAELTELEKAMHLAERKTVWETLHPAARRGGTPAEREKGTGRVKGKKSPKTATMATFGKPESFAKDTAKKTNQSERTVRRLVQIGEQIAPEAAALVEDTPVADRQNDLVDLARLPDQQQVEVARKIKEGEAHTVPDAMKIVGVEPEKKSTTPVKPNKSRDRRCAEFFTKFVAANWGCLAQAKKDFGEEWPEHFAKVIEWMERQFKS